MEKKNPPKAMSFTPKQEKVNTKSNNRRKENIKDDQSQQRLILQI